MNWWISSRDNSFPSLFFSIIREGVSREDRDADRGGIAGLEFEKVRVVGEIWDIYGTLPMNSKVEEERTLPPESLVSSLATTHGEHE
jgi:hypothetical protein